MSVTEGEQQEREKVIKINSCESKNRVSGIREVTRIELRAKSGLPLNTSLPPDSPFRRSYRLKTIKETNNVSDTEVVKKLSPEEKTVWKNSKMFSKTLSSIDGLRSVKKVNQSSVNTVSIDHSTSETNCSDFETTAAVNNKPIVAQTVSSTKTSDWKLLKNKLFLLRKKGNKEFSGVSNISSVNAKDIKSENCESNVGKHERNERSTQGLTQRSISPSESILSRKGSSQERGIVVKKEDLMHIISEASKATKVTKTKFVDNDESVLPSTSAASDITIRKIALKKQHSCGSQSSDKEENNTIKSSNSKLNRSNSSDGETNNENQFNDNEKSVSNVEINKQIINHNKSEVRLSKRSDSIKKQPIPKQEPNCSHCISPDEVDYSENNNDEKDAAAAQLQWDDTLVDPSLLGDAIEAFLRGLGSSSVTNTEKRVSFKKSF